MQSWNRGNEHVKSVWTHLVANPYYKLKKNLSCSGTLYLVIYLRFSAEQVNCKQVLEHSECFQVWAWGFTERLSVYTGFSKTSAVMQPGLRCGWQIVSSSHCSLHTCVSANSVWVHRCHTRLEWFSSVKDKLTCPSQTFSSGQESWEVYFFSLGLEKLSPPKEVATW